MSDAPTDDAVRTALKNQYHAALAMLRAGVDECPEEVWLDGTHTNAFWQIAYHALYFAHLYLQPRLESFEPWPGHQGAVQHEDGIAGPADPESDLPLIPEPYTRAQVLEYCDFCEAMIDPSVDSLDLGSPESGFYWYPVPKLEHQLVNVRHIQHHAAQLADRLRNEIGLGVGWVATRPKSPRG